MKWQFAALAALCSAATSAEALVITGRGDVFAQGVAGLSLADEAFDSIVAIDTDRVSFGAFTLSSTNLLDASTGEAFCVVRAASRRWATRPSRSARRSARSEF